MSHDPSQPPFSLLAFMDQLLQTFNEIGNVPVVVVDRVTQTAEGGVGVEAGWPVGRVHIQDTKCFLGLCGHNSPVDRALEHRIASDAVRLARVYFTPTVPDRCLFGPFTSLTAARQYATTLRRPKRRVNVRTRKSQIDRLVIRTHYVSVCGATDDIATLVEPSPRQGPTEAPAAPTT